MHKIKIKRIYDAPSTDDGYRILVDRLWPRGIKKDAVLLNEWNKMVAPSTKLRKWFAHKPERFQEFTKGYRIELSGKPKELKRILTIAQTQNVTLLYAAKDTKINHAVILFEYLKNKE